MTHWFSVIAFIPLFIKTKRLQRHAAVADGVHGWNARAASGNEGSVAKKSDVNIALVLTGGADAEWTGIALPGPAFPCERYSCLPEEKPV